MNEHVQPDFLLEPDSLFDLLFEESFIPFGGPISFFEGCACLPDFRGLRERADGRGRQWRQIQPGPLDFPPDTERALPLKHLFVHIGDPFLDLRIMNPAGPAPAFSYGTAFRNHLCNRFTSLVDSAREHGYLFKLLASKGHPSFQFFVQCIFEFQVDRAVEKRTGRPNKDAVRAKLVYRFFNQFQCLVQIGPPDIAAVDHAKREHRVF